jgi:hypothetical protein
VSRDFLPEQSAGPEGCPPPQDATEQTSAAQAGDWAAPRPRPTAPALPARATRRVITRRCERTQARLIAHVFHRYDKPIKSLRRAWMTACKDAGRPRLLLNMT